MANQGPNQKDGERQWRLTKEKILMSAGLLLIFVVLMLAVVLSLSVAIVSEFVFAGLTLCGIGIAQWGDRK